ncbi:Growth-regulating factor [Thalictrum thalictroides]|uniref:Growth-regulating factor n=1 Tax=Thalictrum thalictroides TaxID=46969 RepID=A0A7J6XA24_THATH|nr:Growth-regulating factor [Thalictrum thalictroides]
MARVDDDFSMTSINAAADFASAKTLLRDPSSSSSSLLRSNNGQQQMLNFSSPAKPDSFSFTTDYYHHALSTYARNTGWGCGSLNTKMHGGLTGARGPFTPSQWMELEHQALIYKYINANVPIPSNLLIPISKAFNPAAFSAFSGSFRSSTLGWGSFHLGFSGNNDPEPGRCRRTDGKKWRCSRDAVADQKYCERHMNRGRHRSRKPVEGQTGHAAAGPAATKVMAMASGGGASNSLPVAQAQHKVESIQSNADNSSLHSHMNRELLNNRNPGGRLQDSQGQPMLSPAVNMTSKDTPFPCEEASTQEFGFISSDSLLNTSQRSSYIECENFGSQESRVHDPLRHFIDDWPKNQSDRSRIAWSEVEETQSDQKQLSISIPMTSDFLSASPTHEKLALSPLRLSREFDPVQMGLGVGSFSYEPTHRQGNWIPISWESSMGGPLGEVLNHTNNASGDQKSTLSALNLMTEGWDGGFQMELSPTGVLQKTSFGSLSNSSTGSSPRAETNQTQEERSFCDNLLNPTLVNLSTFPIM